MKNEQEFVNKLKKAMIEALKLADIKAEEKNGNIEIVEGERQEKSAPRKKRISNDQIQRKFISLVMNNDATQTH